MRRESARQLLRVKAALLRPEAPRKKKYDTIQVTLKGRETQCYRQASKRTQRSGRPAGSYIWTSFGQACSYQLDAHSASLQLDKLTGSSLIVLDVDGEKHNAIVRDRTKDVIYGHLLHVDFLAVSMQEKLRTQVSIVLIGRSTHYH